MIEDVKILEAIERYMAGEMNPDERVYFESLRKTNPEIDQAVVEHTFFLQQLARFDETRKLKASLNDTHIRLAEKGDIKSPRLKGSARVVYLFNRYKRTAAIAASIAGITALTISTIVSSYSPGKNVTEADVKYLSGEIKKVKDDNKKLGHEINTVKNQLATSEISSANPIVYTTSGTSFLIDTKGYLITNAHVVEKAHDVAVQNTKGTEFRAKLVLTDAKRDIAILKIVDTSFKSPTSVPYSIKKASTDIAEPIFTLGYPRNDMVYGEGYLSAETGYNGDSLAVQISIDANRGNSGSPILNRNGEVIGILNARQTSVEGAVFAVKSKYIYDVLSNLQKADTSQHIKLPATSSLKGATRTQQVKKIADYVYMVKVN